ncbi:hypothetical protein FPV67DRAFT_1443907 [Lyophyllum atratum]|nr:hypothetical protein FPV67DRAFT_1443907 [Lyophyllum atratum]
MAIIGTDPIEKESNNQGGTGPADFEKPGAHRYIGIGMVVGLTFVVLVLWLTLARWPRRKMWERGWLKEKPESIAEMEEANPSPSPRVVDEIIMPKLPEKATTRTREANKPRRSGGTLEPWEAEIDYKVNWEMQQHVAFYERTIIPDHRTDNVPPGETTITASAVISNIKPGPVDVMDASWTTLGG